MLFCTKNTFSVKCNKLEIVTLLICFPSSVCLISSNLFLWLLLENICWKFVTLNKSRKYQLMVFLRFNKIYSFLWSVNSSLFCGSMEIFCLDNGNIYVEAWSFSWDMFGYQKNWLGISNESFVKLLRIFSIDTKTCSRKLFFIHMGSTKLFMSSS
jgi:hypothetical protein